MKKSTPIVFLVKGRPRPLVDSESEKILEETEEIHNPA
jgi:hypothetical protein